MRIKINGGFVFADRKLFEKFCTVAHEEHGSGKEALEKAMDEGLRLAVARREGPEEFERVLNSMGGRKIKT